MERRKVGGWRSYEEVYRKKGEMPKGWELLDAESAEEEDA